MAAHAALTSAVALLGTPFLRPGPGGLTNWPWRFRPFVAWFFFRGVVGTVTSPRFCDESGSADFENL